MSVLKIKIKGLSSWDASPPSMMTVPAQVSKPHWFVVDMLICYFLGFVFSKSWRNISLTCWVFFWWQNTKLCWKPRFLREVVFQAIDLSLAQIKLLFQLCVRSVPQLCLTLWDPMDCSPPGSSVHGILQARTLEWVAMPFSRGSSQPRDQTHVSCISWITGRFFTHWATWEAWKVNRSMPKMKSQWLMVKA